MNREQRRRKFRKMFLIQGAPKYPGDDGKRYVAHTRLGAPHLKPKHKSLYTPSKTGTNHVRHLARRYVRDQVRAGA